MINISFKLYTRWLKQLFWKMHWYVSCCKIEKSFNTMTIDWFQRIAFTMFIEKLNNFNWIYYISDDSWKTISVDLQTDFKFNVKLLDIPWMYIDLCFVLLSLPSILYTSILFIYLIYTLYIFLCYIHYVHSVLLCILKFSFVAWS